MTYANVNAIRYSVLFILSQSYVVVSRMGSTSKNECAVADCPNASIIHMIMAHERQRVDERFFCDEHGGQFLTDYDSRCKVFGMIGRNQVAKFDIELIVLNGNQDIYPIFLREVGGDQRCIRLDAGVFETSSLYWRFKQTNRPRPFAHDAMAMIIESMGGQLQDVLIYELTPQERIYRAYLHIRQGADVIAIDVRPSDALNLAVVCGAPIYISEAALAEAARG